MYCQTKDAQNGVNLIEQQRKRMERADAAAATHKKNMTGGQAAMMKKFRLGSEFLEHAIVCRRMAAEAQNKKEGKKKGIWSTPWQNDGYTPNKQNARWIDRNTTQGDRQPPFPHLATVPEGLNAPEGTPLSKGSTPPLPPVGPPPLPPVRPPLPRASTVQTLLEKQQKRQQEYESHYSKVLALCEPPHSMTCPQLTVMVRWFRQSQDPTIPKMQAALLTTLHAACRRVKQQPPFPHLATLPHAPPALRTKESVPFDMRKMLRKRERKSRIRRKREMKVIASYRICSLKMQRMKEFFRKCKCMRFKVDIIHF